MAEDRIDSIADIAATEAQKNAIIAQIKEIEAAVANAKTSGISIMSASTRKEFDDAMKQAAAGQTQLANSTAKLTDAVKQEDAATKQATVTKKQYTQAAKDEQLTLEASVASRRKLQNSIEALKQDQKEDNQLLKDGILTRQEYTDRMNKSQVTIERYKSQIKDLDAAIKQESATESQASLRAVKASEDAEKARRREQKAVDDATNEYKQLSLAYNEAALRAKNLAIVAPGSAAAKEAAATANALGNQLKVIDGSVGQFQRNVGNYSDGVVKGFQKAFSAVRTVANILPGIGISGIFLAAYEGVSLLIGGLFGLESKAAASEKAMSDLTEELKRSKDATADLKSEFDFLNQIGRVNLEIDFGKNFELPDLRARSVALRELGGALADESARILALQQKNFDDFFTNGNITKKAFEKNEEDIKKALQGANEAVTKNGQEQRVIYRQIELQKKKDAEEAAKAGKDLSEKERKAALDLFKFRQGLLIQEQKAIIAVNTGDTRDAARKRQLELEEELITGVSRFELLQKDITRSGIILIQEKQREDLSKVRRQEVNDIATYAYLETQAILNAAKEQGEELKKLGEQQDAERKQKDQTNAIGNLVQGLDARVRAIEDNNQAELKANSDLYKEGKIKKDEYEKNKLAIENKYRILSLKEQLDYYQNLILLSDLPADKQKEAFDKIRELRKQLNDEDIKNTEKTNDKKIELEKKKNAAIKSLSEELSGLVVDLFIGDIERQKNAIQDLIDRLDIQKQKDIEVANATITNTQDRAAAVALIEARAAAQKEQLERRQRQLDQQRAKFERAASIAKIIGDTASAIAQALPNIPLSILVGAIGAAQIARVLATPIPKYRTGTEDHPGGMAIMGDGGKAEPFVTPDGSLHMSAATPTLYDLPKHTVVYPSMEDYAKQLHKGIPGEVPAASGVNFTPLIGALQANGRKIERAIKNIPQSVIKTEGNWSRSLRKGHNTTTWLNKNL